MEPFIDRARRFNRFYTRAIGVLGDGYLDSAFSLAEARVIYELASRERRPPRQIGRRARSSTPAISTSSSSAWRARGWSTRSRADGDRQPASKGEP